MNNLQQYAALSIATSCVQLYRYIYCVHQDKETEIKQTIYAEYQWRSQCLLGFCPPNGENEESFRKLRKNGGYLRKMRKMELLPTTNSKVGDASAKYKPIVIALFMNANNFNVI